MRAQLFLLLFIALPLAAQVVEDEQQRQIDNLRTQLKETQARLDSLVRTNNPIDLGNKIMQAYEDGAAHGKRVLTFITILLPIVSLILALLGAIGVWQGSRGNIRAAETATEAKLLAEKLGKETQKRLEEIKELHQRIETETKKRLEEIQKVEKVVTRVDYMNQGYNYFSEKNYEEALKAFEKALKQDPNNAKIYNLIGATYAGQKKYDKAVVEYHKAIALDDSQAVFFLNLGLALRSLTKYPESKDAFEKALERQPVYPQVNYQLALTLIALEDYDAALDHLSIWSHANIPPPKSKLWEDPRFKPLQKGKYRKRFIEIADQPPKKEEKK